MGCMSIADEFLSEVEAYLASTDTSATAFGSAALNDSKFVFGLRSGRSPSARTIDRVRDFMKRNRETAA